MRCFFHIGYNGSSYHGWQRQANHLTVQEVLEENLSKLLKEPVTILGCGRTDAKVHASQYFFHLDTKQNGDYDLAFRLNKMLPHDIAVFDIIPASETSHAQYDAKQRTYDYYIHTYKDPFLNTTSALYLLNDLDLSKMKKAVSLLIKHKDYRAFCKSPDQYKHTICNISSAKLFSDNKGRKIRFRISSDRFLHGMIRAIAAKLIKIGKGEMSLDEFENHLITKQAQPNLEFAYPQGLYLSKVVYPYLDIAPHSSFSFSSEQSSQCEWIAV